MTLYRISRCTYITDLEGTGTRLFGGRWSSPGLPGIYLASSRALSVLEVLVHLQPLMIPNNYCLAEISAPENSIEKVDVNSLPANWNDMSPPNQLKAIGDRFLHENKHLLLQLPSSIVPAEFNFLVNPLHSDIKKVRILKREPFSFDERLLHTH
jgi:RES domain-containing protein